MDNQATVQYRLCTLEDFAAVVGFFNTIRSELYLKDSGDVIQMCGNFFARGGAIAGFVNGQLVGAVGYFIGDPCDGYRDNGVGFIYVAGLAPQYRHSAAFRIGLQFTMTHFSALGLREVRLHALRSDVRLNAIYSSFMQDKEPQTNMRGLACNLYRSSLEHIMYVLHNRPKNPRRFDPTPTGRLVAA